LLTTYDIARKDNFCLAKLEYEMIIIDEAHNIKNDKSVLAQVVRKFKAKHKLLLTGTPLQNNLHELWSLLNYLMPQVFDSDEEFTNVFNFDTYSEVEQTKLIQKIQKLLRPFMLRRLKSEVEKGLPSKNETILFIKLSKLQHSMYKKILKDDFHIINGTGDNIHLMNTLMQLKKVCNHPYIFDGVEEGPPFIDGEHLMTNCTKFRVLDKLLPKLKAHGDKVLIFAQMVMLLNILDDYLRYRGYKYLRIDGQTSSLDRETRIDDFMKPESDYFIFLLTTRAGGCGINLHAANVAIIYE